MARGREIGALAGLLLAGAASLPLGAETASETRLEALLSPVVTNAAPLLVQVTNSATFALVPTSHLYSASLETAATTNREDLAAAALATNAAAVVKEAAPSAPAPTNAVPAELPAPVETVHAVDTNLIREVAMDAVAKAVDAVNASAEKVASLERSRRISTRTFKLQHAAAEEVAERFNNMWSGDFGINWKVSKIAQPFPEANVVMVTAPGAILDACEQAIAAIDVEVRQVYIEARFVELQNSAIHKLGIDWSMLDGMGGTASFGGGIDRRNLGNAVLNYSRAVTAGGETVKYDVAGHTASKSTSTTTSTDAEGRKSSSTTTSSTSTQSGRDGGVDYFTGTLNFTDMSLVLSALDKSEDAKIFSNPKIIVANGRKAVVDMTEKYPNVTIAAKRTLNGNSESLDLDMKMAAIPGEDKFMFAKEAFFSWGISLEVTPHVTSNNLISVSIVPTISEKTGEVTAGSSTAEGSKYPIISVQRLVTDFALKAGTTAVIGGLSKTTEEQVDTGIPWLRDWPWIGDKLFGSKSRQKVQKEILVFVTVGLADPQDMKEDVGLPKNAVLGRMYTVGQKLEPGDRTGNAFEGIASLDTRSLDDQARDPLATNVVEKATFHLPFPLPEDRGGKNNKDSKEEK